MMLPQERQIVERLRRDKRSPTDAELDMLQRFHYLRVLMEHTAPVLLESERAQKNWATTNDHQKEGGERTVSET